jgi:serine/threonine protein phosphatase PrpC
LSKQLRLDVAQLTDVGRKRPHNEDNMAYVIPKDEQVMARKGALFIVADGMGGHAAGEVASEIAVDTVTMTYYQDDSEDIALSLMNAIKRANTIIHQRAAENMLRSGMGTTCVSAVLRGRMAYIANVGDSRAYVIRQGRVKQVSQDHSWVEEQVRAGLLTRDQARSHAQRNVITRCLGTQVDVEVDVFTEELEDGDCLILCTDGLSGSVYEDDLRAIVEQYVPQESVYHLVERANENGGPDNITAIVVRVQELGAEPPTTRHLVHVGGSDVSADEDTAILSRPSSSVRNMSMRVDEGRIPSASVHTVPSGPLFSPSSNGNSPQSAVVLSQHKRNHLLYPTLALLVIFVIALFTGGAYYFWHLQIGTGQKLDQATALISQASLDKDAVSALQKLVAAQDDLRSIQSPFLVGSQSDRVAALQNSLQNAGRQAIMSYNKDASINPLCNTITNTNTLNLTSAGGQTPVMTSVLQGQTVASYLLAGDSNLYLLNGQKSQKTKESLPDGAVPFLLASNEQHLFVVTKQVSQGNRAVSYALHMYKPGEDGTLVDESNSPRSIDAKLMRNGEQPKLITVWQSDVYIFLATSNTSTLDILSYNTDHFTDDPQRVQISVSLPLVSAAAFPNQQLFLLTQDGHIKSLALSGGNGSNQSSAVEIPLPRAIATPVGVDPQDFQWNTPLVVPSSQSSGEIQQPFANITGATLLASGSIKEVMYLFVVDNSNHRIIQFQYQPAANAASAAGANGAGAAGSPPATPTQAVGGAAVASPLQYVKQYVSTRLSSVKSIAVAPNQSAVSLLTQTSDNSLSQVSINLVRTCTSSS